ncbi:tripartite tricarboxylate transporter TctB family protein [Puniceibacterium sp. IMCC21224]|uniref:tripartite tricarboxylate transporter TctB family protein n=1 Tax=Puniceibacterium sp. IMCC21224 TaxID=1618204 RepID=UPI00064DBD75|nr:tripartite tricarboxylate transporter TctB family protein [Puniceibacterium sp. IMCC21224]KMK65093.1 Tripartite tricarboxylate transporter TctB family [Puniceibacterium sp. IMCC21224]
MKLHDALLGVIFVALGATVIAFSYSFPTPRHLAYGPGMFPRLMGAGMALSGAALVVMGLRHRAALVEWPAWLSDRRLTRNVLLIPSVCLFYYLFVTSLGFHITATLLLLALLLSGEVAPLRALIVSLSVVFITTLQFISILHVPLPWGVLAPISGWFIW